MQEQKKRPYYGVVTKREVVLQYQTEATSVTELSALHGIGGSNTVCEWVKKFGDSSIQKPTSMQEESKEAAVNKKKKRQKRQRSYEQLRISELESQLEEARQRVQLYAIALTLVSEEAGEDLLKKNGSK